jgi:hypothetical protein
VGGDSPLQQANMMVFEMVIILNNSEIIIKLTKWIELKCAVEIILLNVVIC